MAILTDKQKSDLRNGLEETSAGGPVTYVKSEVNDAFQAIEDFIESNRTTVSSDIDTAVGGFIFTNAQKKFMFAYYCDQKFRRDK